MPVEEVRERLRKHWGDGTTSLALERPMNYLGVFRFCGIEFSDGHYREVSG